MSDKILLSNRLDYRLEPWEGGRILSLYGEADYVAVPTIRTVLRELLALKLPLLLVDLTEVTFLNTPFWAALQIHQQDGRPHSALAVCGMNAALTAAFTLNGVGDEEEDGSRIVVYPTLEEAKRLSGVRKTAGA